MVFDYLITFKKRSDATVDAISQLMYFFALGAFSYFAYSNAAARPYYLGLNLAILITWIFCIQKKSRTGAAMFRFGLFLAAVGWLMTSNWITGYSSTLLFPILYAVAGLIEKQVKFPDEIGFSAEFVVVNTFPKKKFTWTEIQNVVLKDNLLTVDFKNNKLIQKELNEDVAPSVEQEFNDFCKARLSNTGA